MTVSQTIKQAIASSGFTPAEIEAKAGIDRTTLCRLSLGRRLPSLDQIERLAGPLGLDVAVLLEQTQDEALQKAEKVIKSKYSKG